MTSLVPGAATQPGGQRSHVMRSRSGVRDAQLCDPGEVLLPTLPARAGAVGVEQRAYTFPRAGAYAFSMATTVRVSEATRARAAALAASRGRSIGEVVDEALEALETADFWRKTQEALRRHPVALDEDPVWEQSVADGLDRE